MDKKIIDETNFSKAHSEIQKTKAEKKLVVVLAKDEEFNRKVLEKEKDIILLLKQKGRKDKQKQRNSGLDNVTADIAKKSDNEIGIDFDEIVSSIGEERARILSRIIQNIKLCNKKKVKMKFISLKNKNLNKHDLKSLGISLGMSTKMADESID